MGRRDVNFDRFRMPGRRFVALKNGAKLELDVFLCAAFNARMANGAHHNRSGVALRPLGECQNFRRTEAGRGLLCRKFVHWPVVGAKPYGRTNCGAGYPLPGHL